MVPNVTTKWPTFQIFNRNTEFSPEDGGAWATAKWLSPLTTETATQMPTLPPHISYPSQTRRHQIRNPAHPTLSSQKRSEAQATTERTSRRQSGTGFAPRTSDRLVFPQWLCRAGTRRALPIQGEGRHLRGRTHIQLLLQQNRTHSHAEEHNPRPDNHVERGETNI